MAFQPLPCNQYRNSQLNHHLLAIAETSTYNLRSAFLRLTTVHPTGHPASPSHVSNPPPLPTLPPSPPHTMSARTSGADPTPNGDAKNRAHHDGSSGRAFTVEQKTAVIRIRKCAPTAFYEILGLEEVKATCSDGEIKKAYRKLSLLTHPDKNGFEGADEAFKSRLGFSGGFVRRERGGRVRRWG